MNGADLIKRNLISILLKLWKKRRKRDNFTPLKISKAGFLLYYNIKLLKEVKHIIICPPGVFSRWVHASTILMDGSRLGSSSPTE